MFALLNGGKPVQKDQLTKMLEAAYEGEDVSRVSVKYNRIEYQNNLLKLPRLANSPIHCASGKIIVENYHKIAICLLFCWFNI